MRAGNDWVGRITDDLIVALGFYTRLPFRPDSANSGEEIARASWAAPLAGAVLSMTDPKRFHYYSFGYAGYAYASAYAKYYEG